jgi:peptidoglycan L-alanyl-D-glutamate endopeptidase CwlK
MIASRKIEDLHPKVRDMCSQFVKKCHDAGIDVIITSTYRDNESQDVLYAQGRTKPGKKVTNAKGGHSFHNYRLAFDFAPLVNGKIPWDDSGLFAKCGAIAESVGLEWAGNWKSFKEMAHCQWTNGLNISQLLAGETVDGR